MSVLVTWRGLERERDQALNKLATEILPVATAEVVEHIQRAEHDALFSLVDGGTVWRDQVAEILLAICSGDARCVRSRLGSDAACRGAEFDVKSILNDGSVDGLPILHVAILARQAEAVAVLLSHGADPNFTTKPFKGHNRAKFAKRVNVGRISPLWLAVGLKEEAIVSHLIAAGANDISTYAYCLDALISPWELACHNLELIRRLGGGCTRGVPVLYAVLAILDINDDAGRFRAEQFFLESCCVRWRGRASDLQRLCRILTPSNSFHEQLLTIKCRTPEESLYKNLALQYLLVLAATSREMEGDVTKWVKHILAAGANPLGFQRMDAELLTNAAIEMETRDSSLPSQNGGVNDPSFCHMRPEFRADREVCLCSFRFRFQRRMPLQEIGEIFCNCCFQTCSADSVDMPSTHECLAFDSIDGRVVAKIPACLNLLCIPASVLRYWAVDGNENDTALQLLLSCTRTLLPWAIVSSIRLSAGLIHCNVTCWVFSYFAQMQEHVTSIQAICGRRGVPTLQEITRRRILSSLPHRSVLSSSLALSLSPLCKRLLLGGCRQF